MMRVELGPNREDIDSRAPSTATPGPLAHITACRVCTTRQGITVYDNPRDGSDDDKRP